MRVSSFSKLSVMAIGVFAIIFLTTMYQVGTAFTESRRQYSSFQTLKSLTTVKFYRAINTYLQNGDASFLSQAQHQLTEIINLNTKLTLNSSTSPITAQASLLQNNLATKYRAMGKISGDPLTLLRNSEQNMLSINYTLAKYAATSSTLDQSTRITYLQLCSAISQALTELMNSREKAFTTRDFANKNIHVVLDDLTRLTEQFANLPLLAIFENPDESEGDLLVEDEKPTDLSKELISELRSLVNRFKSDLNTTLLSKRQKSEGLALLNDDVAKLEKTILLGEQKVIVQEQLLNSQLYNTVLALLSFLVIFLISNYGLQRRVIIKPLSKLRDSFVMLVEKGQFENISGISPETELGEISTSFNKMVNKLSQDDTKKSHQLDLVAVALTTMESQVKNIYHSSSSTSNHVQGARAIMEALGQATETVNTLSNQVVNNAQATQQAMEESQSRVSQVLSASKSTSLAAHQSKSAIVSLSQSVDSVGSIVGVISAIANQTNLLALNAAIEAARAGEHGRGFSVVADEVRQLAGKTQDSLKQISQRLEQLQTASSSIEQTIYEIEIASENQRAIADKLQQTTIEVTGQAQLSATVAQNTLEQITLQQAHFEEFEQAMRNVDQEVTNSQTLANVIAIEVNNHVTDIGLTLEP